MSLTAESSSQTPQKPVLIPQQQSTVEFLSELKEPGSFEIGMQSLFDALDLWISSIKYYFDAMNPASGSISSKMFLEWLHSEEGLLIFLIGSACFGLFAYLGNGIKKEDRTVFSSFADNYWPYVRDVIKRLKWTFKGTRSLLLVSQTLFHQNYISYITPFGILLGLVGAVNQLWNRSMVEARKSLQQSNDLFRRQVKGINACFLEVDDKLLPDDIEERQKVLKHIYAGSILAISKGDKQDYLLIDKDGKEKTWSACLDGFSKEQQEALNAFLDLLKETLKDLQKDKDGQSHVPRVYWEQYKQLLDSQESLFNDANISQEKNPFWQIFHAKQEFIKDEVLNVQSDTYLYLKNAAQFQQNSTQAFASAILSGLLNAPYYFLGVLSMVVLPSQFFIYAVAVCSFFMVLNVISEYDQEADYQRRLKTSQLKANLIMNKRMLLLEWQNFTPIREEFDKLEHEIAALLSILKVKNPELANLISKKFPSVEGLEKQDLNSNAIQGMDLSKIDLSAMDGTGISEKQKDILNFCVRVENLEREYLKNHLDLSKQLELSSDIVWRQSLRNGLVVYGAFNSLLMTVATMSFLFGLTITPIFFYISVLVGLSILIATISYTWLFIRPKEEKSVDDEDADAEVLGVAKTSTFSLPAEKTPANTLYVSPLTYDIMNIPEIRGTSNLLIPEHAEVFRQTLSGAKKGIKCSQTLLSFFVMASENVNPALMSIYLGVSAVYASFFACKGLRGLMRVDNDAYKESFMYTWLTGEKRPSEVNEQVAHNHLKQIRIFRIGSSEALTTRPQPSPRGL
jgi:hypothetical protein